MNERLVASLRPLAMLTVAAALLVSARSALGRVGGVSGSSGAGETSCTQCHSGGIAPSVVLTGPSELPRGRLGTFTLTLSGGQELAGGLDVAVEAGTLVVAPGEETTTHLLNGELVHSVPKAGAVIAWTFQWVAPDELGAHTIFAAGNSVNLDDGSSGDMSAATTWVVTVTEGCPDRDADGYEAADCNPSVTSGGGDCDDDAGDIHPGLAERCDGVDQDCDGETDEDPARTLCDDGDICTTDTCVDAVCEHPFNTAPCSDDDPCTGDDQCLEGLCIGAVDVICDDGLACTSDRCEAGVGCVYEVLDSGPCDDGNPCTSGDSCQAGACVGGENTCACETDADCAAYDDGDLCNGAVRCDPASALCVVDPATVVVCDASNDTDCAQSTCSPVSGLCARDPLPDGRPCGLGDACVSGATCLAGVCMGGEPVSCDDGNPCTVDRCDPVGGCLHDNLSVACDDGDPCTGAGMCRGGACVSGPPLDCSDGDPCTSDRCDPMDGCLHAAASGVPCDDGDACTRDDECQDGSCVPGDAIDCDDGNPCTEDLCDAELACVHREASWSCDDGDVCTEGDRCHAGVCLAGPAADCDDDNPCTDDTCEPLSGCVHTANTAPCDDGDLCTVADRCVAGACAGGSPRTCDDFDVCTTDRCDETDGCLFEAIARCCVVDGDCLDGQRCVDLSCQGAAICATCETNDDCGGPDDACLTLGDGKRCAVACLDGTCPEPDVYVCDESHCQDGTCVPQCVPRAGACVCASHDHSACHDGDVWWFDGCDGPEAVDRICENGCREGDCVETAPVYETDTSLAGGTDIVGVSDGGGGSGGGGGGGCDAGRGAGAGPFALLLLVVAIVWRGGRADRGARRRAG